MRGIHPTNRRLFFPAYTFSSAKMGPLEEASTGATLGPSAFKCVKKRTAPGRMFDKHVEESFQLFRTQKGVTLGMLGNTQHVKWASLFMLLPKRQVLAIKRKLKKWSSSVYAFWRWVSLNKLLPVATQVAVGSEVLRLATSVDLVCLDKQGKVWLLETKLGFQTYLQRHTGKSLCAPFTNWNDCVAHQQQLQILGTKMLFEHTFPDRKVAQSLIVRMRPQKDDSALVDYLPLQKDMQTHASAMLQCYSSSA